MSELLDSNNLDYLDLHDSTHISFDSVMSIANEFSEGKTADPIEYHKPVKESTNVEFCVGMIAVYVTLLVYGIIVTSNK